MGVMETLLITTAIAGVAGTGLGGAVGALFRRDSDKTISLLLGFAGGVMLSIVCFDLLGEALDTGLGVWKVVAAVLLGVLTLYLLHTLLDKKTKLHDNTEMLTIGLAMVAAISLHNMPEGMTLGASYAANEGVMGSAALLLAVLIGFHNIPVGMAISAPLIGGGMSRAKAIAIAAASGIPTIIGACIGYGLGDIGASGLAVSLGFASGAMLLVVFDDLIPQAIRLYHSKLPALFIILGILLGLVVIY